VGTAAVAATGASPRVSPQVGPGPSALGAASSSPFSLRIFSGFFSAGRQQQQQQQASLGGRQQQPSAD